MKKGAKFSSKGYHRLVLWRVWKRSKGLVCFIGLNPSTADGIEDDATIRRLIGFTKRWGYGGFYIVNLFSKVGTKFATVKFSNNLIIKNYDKLIEKYARKSNIVCLMYGDKGTHRNRNEEVYNLLKSFTFDIYCFKVTKKGNPGHPLYLPNCLYPIKYLLHYEKTKTNPKTNNP